MATLFGTILRPDLTPYVGRVGLFPIRRDPTGHGLYTIAWAAVQVETNPSGFFTTPLAAGEYWIYIGNSLRRHIRLRDDSRYYLLQDLLADGAWGIAPQNYRETPGGMQFLNGTTGEFHAVALAGDAEAVAWRIYALGDVLDPDTYKVVTGTAFFRVDQDGPWHAPYLSGPADDPAMLFGPADAQVTGGNFRIQGGRWQLRNVTTGQHHSFFLLGSNTDPTWAIGPGE